MITAIGLGESLLLLLSVVSLVAEGKPFSRGGWKVGRATYYGENGSGGDDGFSIHHGSCQFGQLDPDVGTGWDIAAMSDAHPDFQGSCGKCYELACSPMDFRDNYGGSVNRMNCCRDESKSLIVTIVDSCPCNYAKNAYNNKRWCCGDMDHFDLSTFAFNKLAPMMHGVIGIKYRPVPCPSYEDVMPTKPKIILPPMPTSDEETTEGPRDTILTGSSPAKKTSPVKVTVPATAIEVEEEPTEPEAVPPAVRALPFTVPTLPIALPGLRPSVSARTPAVPTLPSTIEPRPPSVPALPTELRIEQMSRPTSPIFMAIPAPSPEEEIDVDLDPRGDVELQLSLDVDMDKSEPEEATEDAVPPASSITITSKSAVTSRSGTTVRSTAVGSLVPGDVPDTPLREGADETEVVVERVSRVSSGDITPTTGFEYTVFDVPPVSMPPPILSPQAAAPSTDSGMLQTMPTPAIAGAGSPTSKSSSPLPPAEWDVVKCSRGEKKLQIYDGGFHECFTDGGLLRYEDSNTMGMDGSPAWCTTVEPGRSIAAISVGRGTYKGKSEISFRIKAGDERPEVSVALVGTKGPCPQVHLNSMVCTKPHLGYRTFYAPLSSLTSATSEEFEGCGSNEAEDIYAIAFKSEQDVKDLRICIDSIELY